MIDGALLLKSTAEGILKRSRFDYTANYLRTRQLPLEGTKLMFIAASGTVPKLQEYPGRKGGSVGEDELNDLPVDHIRE